LQKLHAVHARHGMVEQHQIRLLVDGLQQRVGGIGERLHGAELRQRLTQHLQHHGIVIDKKDLDIAGHET
jgi:hypothetical protein